MVTGTVKDITFDLPRGKMFIIMADDKGKETEVSSDNVSAVGDVVLLGSEKSAKTVIAAAKPAAPSAAVPAATPVMTPQSTPKTSSTPGLCPNCNFQNEPESHFCIKCGTKLK